MNKKSPLRMCVGCREMKTKKELIRIIRTPDERFEIDHTGKQNGRGAYICKSEMCLESTIKNRGLERSLKTKIPNQVYEGLKKELTE